MGGAVVETPRLTLRRLAPDDLDALAAMLADWGTMRYWHRRYTRPEAAAWIEEQRTRYARDGYGWWLAVERATGVPVGQAGLLGLEIDGAGEVCLGYMVHRPYWRRGFGSEAAKGCLDHAFTALGVGRVLAPVRPENIPSRRLAERLGMTSGGRRTRRAGLDHLVYAIAREAWLSRRRG